ncbi:MAG: hypothetical protein ACYC5N_04350, partial [Endomicrobiales bacterium]
APAAPTTEPEVLTASPAEARAEAVAPQPAPEVLQEVREPAAPVQETPAPEIIEEAPAPAADNREEAAAPETLAPAVVAAPFAVVPAGDAVEVGGITLNLTRTIEKLLSRGGPAGLEKRVEELKQAGLPVTPSLVRYGEKGQEQLKSRAELLRQALAAQGDPDTLDTSWASALQYSDLAERLEQLRANGIRVTPAALRNFRAYVQRKQKLENAIDAGIITMKKEEITQDDLRLFNRKYGKLLLGRIVKVTINPLAATLRLLGWSLAAAQTELGGWLATNAPRLQKGSFVVAAKDLDWDNLTPENEESLRKLTALQLMGMNVSWIRAARRPEGEKLCTVIVPLAGEDRIVEVYAQEVTVSREDEEGKTSRGTIGLLSLYDTGLRVEGTGTGKINLEVRAPAKPVAEEVLFGFAALKLLERIEEDPVVRKELYRRGIRLERADVLELGAGAGFANPALYDDPALRDMAQRTLVVNNPGSGTAGSISEELLREQAGPRLDWDFLRSAVDKGEVSLDRLGLLADRTIGDEALKKRNPALAGLIHVRSFSSRVVEEAKKLVVSVYAPGVEDKAKTGMIGNFMGVAEMGSAAAIRNDKRKIDPGIGKLSDWREHFLQELVPGGIHMLQFLSLTDPRLKSLRAGDALLVDWGKVISGLRKGRLSEADRSRIEGLLASPSAGRSIDREEIGRRETAIAGIVYDALNDSNEFKRYARNNRAWLDQAARELGLAGRDAEIFAMTQWLFDRQVRGSLAEVAGESGEEGQVFFTLRINRENSADAAAAIRHWFAFGFKGVRLEIEPGMTLDTKLVEDINAAIRAASSPTVTWKLAESAGRDVLDEIHRIDAMVEDEEVAKIALPEGYVPSEPTRDQEFILQLVRDTLSPSRRFAFAFVPMGLLWNQNMGPEGGKEVRMLTRGERSFNSDFAREFSRLVQRGPRTPEEMYAKGYADGLKLGDIPATGDETLRALSRAAAGDGGNVVRLAALLEAYEQKQYDMDYFDAAIGIFGQLALPERDGIVEHLQGIRNEALKNPDKRALFNTQLIGFVRGTTAKMLEDRHIDLRRASPVRKADRTRLEALLLLAYQLDYTPDDLREMARTGAIPAEFRAQGSLMQALLEESKGKTVIEMSGTVNPVVNAIVEKGAWPESAVPAGTGREAQGYALSELLNMLPAIDEWKELLILDETTRKALNVIRTDAVQQMRGAA